MLLYPVYAVLFADTGLSPAQISSLFIIWSVTSFAVEIPSGLWADTFSRRKLLALGPLLAGTGFGLWTLFPSYVSFAVGFMLWGGGNALRSGSFQALAYEELARVGAAGSYARLVGRSEAVAGLAQLVSGAVAAPVLAIGGYLAVGLASVGACVVDAAVALTLPEHRDRPAGAAPGPEDTGDPGDVENGGELGFVAVLRAGLDEVRRAAPVRRAVVFVSVLMGVASVDEYVPLLVEATGVGRSALVPLVMLVLAGAAVGGWLAGKGARLLVPALVVAAGCLAAGSASGRPEGIALVAVAFGILYWANAVADARLQDLISDRSRATVTSMAGFGAEIGAVLTFAAYGLGLIWAGPGLLVALAALPVLLVALAARRR